MTEVWILEYLNCDIGKSHEEPRRNNCVKNEGKSSWSSAISGGQKKRKRKRKMEVMYICFRCWQLTQAEGISGLFNPVLFFIAVFKIASILSRSTSTLKLNRLLDWHSQNVLFY